MENKLRQLMDFQKYENSPGLQSVIDSVHARYASRSNVRELDLSEMEMVNAAGVPDPRIEELNRKDR